MTSNLNKIDISKYEGYVELGFGNNWKYVTSIRTFIQNFICISLNSIENADKISLASSELVENAIKYSSRDDIPIRFKLTIGKAGSEVRLRMEVQNHSTDENIEIIKVEFDKIMKNSPYEAYLKKVEEIAARDDGKTMLGLARIRYETGCELNIKIENTILTIEAEFTV